MITPMIRKTRSPGHMVVDGSKTPYFTVLTLFMGNSLAKGGAHAATRLQPQGIFYSSSPLLYDKFLFVSNYRVP